MNTLGQNIKEEFEQNRLMDGEMGGWTDGTGYSISIFFFKKIELKSLKLFNKLIICEVDINMETSPFISKAKIQR